MHATPAAISDRIRTLEEELGVRLFQRDSRHVRLTEPGVRLLPYAEQMLSLHSALKVAVRDSSAQSGQISLGVIESVVHTTLPELLHELKQEHAGIVVELHSESTLQLKRLLASGQLSLAVMADEMDGDNFENIALASDPMIWVTSPPLADGIADEKAFEQLLSQHPVMTFMKDTPAWRDIQRIVSPLMGVRLSPFSSIAAILSLLREGYGVAALPFRVVQPYLRAGELIQLDHGPQLAPLRLVVARSASGRQPIVDAVTDLVLKICARQETA